MNKEMKKTGIFSDIEQFFGITWKKNPTKELTVIMHRKIK